MRIEGVKSYRSGDVREEQIHADADWVELLQILFLGKKVRRRKLCVYITVLFTPCPDQA